MVSLKDFTDDFAVELIGCPKPLMERTVRDAAIDLCEQTFLLKDRDILVSVGADEFLYDLTLGPGHDLIGIDHIDIGSVGSGKTLPVTTEHDLLERYGDDWKSLTGHEPKSAFIDGMKKLRVFPIPLADMDEDLVITANVKPAQSASTIDNIFYTDYRVPIANYCRWHLMAIPNQVWSNPKLASYYEIRYNISLATAQILLMKNFTNKSSHVKSRSFIV